MNLEKQANFVATVTGTDVKKDQTTIHCITNMESYGRVRFSVTLEIAGDRSGGAAYGSGRGAMKDGTFFAGEFYGVWSREGTKVTIRYVDRVTDGTQNVYEGVFDATEDEIRFEQYRFA